MIIMCYQKAINFNNTNQKIIKIFSKCKDYSLKSQMKSKHCACLVKSGKIYDLGTNDYYGWNNIRKFSVHAEEKIILNYIKKKPRKKFDLYIIRVSEKNGNFLNSKPCSDCIKIIQKYKVDLKVILLFDSLLIMFLLDNSKKNL